MTERQVLDARTRGQWEQWLEHNHDTASEIWLRLLNKNAPEAGMSYGEAVEIALCFGWIDSSAWSKSNVERVQRLIDAGRVRQAGQREIDAAKADGRWPTS